MQDNDPSQTSKVAIGSLSATGAPHLILPARSPDLNPIENMFDTKKRRLPDQALSRNTVSESEAELKLGLSPPCTRLPGSTVTKPPPRRPQKFARLSFARGAGRPSQTTFLGSPLLAFSAAWIYCGIPLEAFSVALFVIILGSL